jgi:hypothetical protein
MGSGDPVGSPESECRPATTTMEAPKPLTMDAFEPAALVDWNGGQCNIVMPVVHSDAACAWVVLPQ